MKFKYKTITGGVLATVFVGAWFLYFSPERRIDGEMVEKTYQKLERSELTVSVTELGVLRAVNNTSIKNPLDGTSKIIFIVPQGKIVKKGDKLVELDTSEIETEIKKLELDIENDKTSVDTADNSLVIDISSIASDTRSAREAITFAEMDLKKFQELDKAQQIRDAETDIKNAEDAFRLAKQKFEWSEKLAEKGFETKSQVDLHRLEVNLKTKAEETAKSKQKMLITFDLKKQEVELHSKLAEAKDKLARVIKQGESKSSKARSVLASAKRRLQLNQDRLAEKIALKEKSKIFAPKGGLVLYSQNNNQRSQWPIGEGTSVTKNRELIIMPDISTMKVRLKIPEFHISKIEEGQEAFVTIDSVQSGRLKAKVTSVSAVPDRNTAWYQSGEKFYVVEVLITDPLPNVKPSVSAKAEIIIKDLKDVLSIPLQSIKTEKGKHFCFVKNRGNSDEKRPIKLGYINNTHAEVLDGLKENEEILLTAPF